MSDPVSWLLIERGWEVLAADGSRVGKVDRTLGDEELDIFDGLSISTGLVSRRVYVAAERIHEIRDGRVLLDLSPAEVDELGPDPRSRR